MSEFAVYWRIALYAVLAAAALNDIRRFEIPNILSIAALVLLAAALAFTTPVWEPAFWRDAAGHAAGGLGAFIIGFVFFALGIMGGGDVKLFTAVGFWFGLGELGELAALIAFAGFFVGLGAAALYLLRGGGTADGALSAGARGDAPAQVRMGRFRRALRQRAPYGVAIFLGAIAAGELSIFSAS